MNSKLKQLTGKNPKDFEPAAAALINDSDVELFKELVDSDDFLFDFVKQNVASRLEKACNEKNYLNLMNFLKFYSPSYEDFIVKTLAKYADEDLTDRMLEIFENGTDDEKTYCAKFFSFVKDPLAIDLLKKYAFSQNSDLSANCIQTLAAFGDREIFNQAVTKLNSDDDFEQLEAVKLLVSYGDKSVAEAIIEVAKYSSMAENIAAELPYLTPLCELKQDDKLFILNLIIDGLGEIISLSQVFDFDLYNVFEDILNSQISSKESVVLLNAKEKFCTLTDNDEYLYDEAKDVKQEILDIKSLLMPLKNLSPDGELKPESLFVFSALELTSNTDKVRNLLNCSNKTVIIKSLEILKKLNSLSEQDKDCALSNISDKNLIDIIKAM